MEKDKQEKGERCELARGMKNAKDDPGKKNGRVGVRMK